MSKSKPEEFNRIIYGIADYDKEARPYSVSFSRRVNYRSDPRKWELLPGATKESGSVVQGLIKWGERVSDTTYLYDDAGYIYSRSLTGTVSNLRQVSGSSGNGLCYFGEDDFLYYTTDTAIGRYGRMGGTPAFVDDFLGAEGGVPLNTASMDFEASSSMSADASDSASISLTGDLTLEGWYKFESLPSEGNHMTLISKWEEQDDDRSYKMAVACISGFFGDGSDGALTISSSATQAPTDATCTGTSGAYSLSATNASFASGQIILIHQTDGTNAGTFQYNKITGYTAGTISLENALNATYTAGAQVIVMPQYTNVTINSGKTYTAKAWDGDVGGILALQGNGTITVTGTITATEKGFTGGLRSSTNSFGQQGNNTAASQAYSSARIGNGGGGGEREVNGQWDAGGGGGGANGSSGSDGESYNGGVGGLGGAVKGSADLTTMVFGGGGGGGGGQWNADSGGGQGGSGGGIIVLNGVTVTVTGSVTANGGDGEQSNHGSGGGGAGGSILINAQTATLGSSLVTATAGSGGDSPISGDQYGGDGGNAGFGRIHLNYYTSYSGTTSPTLNVSEDQGLSANTAYHLRLYVSSDGTSGNSEYYTKEASTVTTSQWVHLAVAWDASESTAYFYVDGETIGTAATGSQTSIDDNDTVLCLAADLDGSGDEQNFFDGKMDEVRVWSDIRSAGEISANRLVELAGTEAGLAAYYQLDSGALDETANNNDLTLRNSPTYDTDDVPFSAPTTRNDIDQASVEAGDTYALGTTIDETAVGRQSFVPAKDPQKSIEVNIAAIGTGNWTLTVHDAQNREVASKTVAVGDLNTGDFEFVFDSVWTPVIGATYHFHLTSTVADGTVVSTTNNDLEDGDFTSYYQFLIEDTNYHPIEPLLNFITIGNGRYVAKWDGVTYEPHKLTLPSGWNVRCTAKWRHYAAYGLCRGDDVSDYDQGMIIFWDGISDTYDHFVDVPQGAVNAMLGSQGTLYIIAGYQGDLLEYTGGDKPKKVKRLPNLAKDEQLEVMPGAMTMWQTLLRIGAGVTDSSDFEQGIYSYGKLNEDYPDSLSYDYYISTEKTQDTSVEIGMLLPVAKKLLIGWKDNVSYGLDSIDLSDSPVASGSVELTIQDSGRVSKEKLFEVIRADFEPLNSGESVSLQYKLDRSSAWSTEELEDTADEDKVRLNVKDGRHKEYQGRVNLYTTTTTSPKILAVTVGENKLEGEEQL